MQNKSYLMAIVAFLLLLPSSSFAVLTWTGNSSSWTKGTGTESDPYQIETPDQLAFLSEMVRLEVSNYEGIYFLQKEDFDMDSVLFTPIGSGTTIFKGNYDGGNHYVANLYLNATDNDYLALFGRVEGSKMSNITIKGTHSSNAERKNKAGLIACGTDISLFNCTNESDITNTYSSRDPSAGGLVCVCQNSSKLCIFTECHNSGAISAPNYVFADPCIGGILGATDPNNPCSFTRCTNSGNLSANASYSSVGGIMGNGDAPCKFLACNNSGHISASAEYYGASAGGIMGKEWSLSNENVFTECFNTGNISATATHSDAMSGGIAGCCYGTYTKCFSSGNISATSATFSLACGIVAEIKDGIVSNCYARGTIEGQSEACGLGKNCVITNSYFAGTILATKSYSLTNDAVSNSYYNTNCGAINLQGIAKTDAELKSADMISLLNKDSIVWTMDRENVNDGYPIFGWMLPQYTISCTYDSTMGNVIGLGKFISGDTATISAIPHKGYHFVNWGDGNTDNPRKIIVSQDTTLVANFEQTLFLVTLLSADTTLGYVIGGGEAYINTSMQISAVCSKKDYHFTHWNDGSTVPGRKIIVESDTTLIAYFEEDTPAECVTVDVNNPLLGSADIKIVATPASGATFSSWSDGNTDNPRTVTNAPMLYTAIFASSDPTKIDNVSEKSDNDTSNVRKIILDNTLFIIRDGKTYNAQGAVVE